MFEKFIWATNRTEKEENYKRFQRLRTFNAITLSITYADFLDITTNLKTESQQLLLLLLLNYFKLTSLQIIPYKNIQYKKAK